MLCSWQPFPAVSLKQFYLKWWWIKRKKRNLENTQLPLHYIFHLTIRVPVWVLKNTPSLLPLSFLAILDCHLYCFKCPWGTPYRIMKQKPTILCLWISFTKCLGGNFGGPSVILVYSVPLLGPDTSVILLNK